MKAKDEFVIPNTLLQTLISKYQGGLSIMDLHIEYNIPFAVLSMKLLDYKVNVSDFISESLGKIMNAESQLIEGTFPNYKMKDDLEWKKYKSLLFYYSTSDLNSGYVHISNNLLK